MRRSSVVKLTLLPMLATAAVAATSSADPPGETQVAEGQPADPAAMPPVDPGLPTSDPPIEAPGMTPTILELTCDDDPNWRLRPDCNDYDYDFYYDGGVIRGGFGTYFYGGGGGGG